MLWGGDPAPAAASGMLWLHGSTCTKHFKCASESTEGCQYGENGKRFVERTAKIPPPSRHCSRAERGDGCSSSYLLQVLLRPGTGVLWQGWLRFQSRGARALAACSFLPVFWLNLGAGNGVRQGRSSLLGKGTGRVLKPQGKQGLRSPREARKTSHVLSEPVRQKGLGERSEVLHGMKGSSEGASSPVLLPALLQLLAPAPQPEDQRLGSSAGRLLARRAPAPFRWLPAGPGGNHLAQGHGSTTRATWP